MPSEKTPGILNRLSHIYNQAAGYTGDDCCMVAPSPELRNRIRSELETLRETASGPVANLLKVKSETPPGLNDGLVYPGSLFPLGTPVRLIRNAAADRTPISGSVRVIVVLVEFSDRKFSLNRQHYEELFFSQGVLPNGSVREYYREVTNQLVDIIGEVVGPFTLPLSLAQYSNGASGMGMDLPNARSMARHAAQAADPNVDFGDYDNNGDGFVDAFIVLHAGPGAEVTGDPNGIWSHKWVLANGQYNADGTNIYAYLTVPEDSRIGVCCHELGHLLFGFPDLYDTDYSSEGVGNWCLMAGGSWNGGGEVPAHPSAWCKANQGWVTVVNQTRNATVTLPSIQNSHTVYRLWKNGAAGSEYFLIENRQKTLYDRLLPGAGLLVWHVDESIFSNSDENHPKVALVQADGNCDLENGNDRGDGGDPFPGSANKTSWNTTSTPNSKSYAGVSTGISISSIQLIGEEIKARLTVRSRTRVKGLKDFLKDLKEKDLKDLNKDTKEVEKPGEAVMAAGDGAGQGELTNLEHRVAALETKLAAIEPFINSSLRPDLSGSPLAYEEDLGEIQSQMEEGAARAKRLYDAPNFF